MDALFGHYSFEAASRRTVCDDTHKARSKGAAMDVSPTSIAPAATPARLPTPPSCSIGDLAHALDRHDLHITVDTSVPSRWEPLASPSDDVSFSTEPSERSPTQSTSRLNAATLRMQRQLNVRLQCSTSHVKDITKLVEMIESEDQCIIHERKPATIPSSANPDEDEAIDMDYTPTEKEKMSLSPQPWYRASNEGVRVVKRTRMRVRRPRASNMSSK